MTPYAGTWPLLRLALRRDRVMLAVWVLALAGSAAGSAAATKTLYPTAAARAGAALALNTTPALVGLYGHIYDPTSLGAVAMFKLGGFGAALTGLLAILVTVRHTRAEEDSGRLELVAAAAVGRRAPLTAAVLVAATACLGVGLATAAGLAAAGLPPAGSLALGLSWAACGAVFTGAAAVAAQVAPTARAANGAAGIALAAAYLLRAAGDSVGPGGPQWLSWLSPVGWAQQVRPFASERWWVLALPVVSAAVTTGAALTLARRRDQGSGLLPDRTARVAASWLGSPLTLAWRLQRASLVTWTACFALLGSLIGAIASGVGSMLGSAPARDLITRLGGSANLTDAFMAAELGFATVIASAYGVQAAARLATEETSGRAEQLLATATGRVGWAAGHIGVALGGTAAALVAAGLGAGLTTWAHTGHPGDVGSLLAAAAVRIPAAWLVTAITVAAFGVGSRLVTAGWVALGAFLLIGELGPVLRLNHLLVDLSPFTHVPQLPGGPLRPAALGWLVAACAALIVAGVLGLRRRDLG